MKKNFDREAKRYQQLLAELSSKYKVYYVNLSLGVGNDLKVTAKKIFLSKENLKFIVNGTINICLRTTYYIFCIGNKGWADPELLNW